MIDLTFYQNQIQQIVEQPATVDQPATKILDIFSQLSHKKVFEFNGSTDLHQFPAKIQKTLEKIATLKIGQDLLTFFINHPQDMPLCFEFCDKGFSYSPPLNRIYLHSNAFRLWSNGDSQPYWDSPFKVSFVHELLHYKHSLENKEKFEEMLKLSNSRFFLNPLEEASFVIELHNLYLEDREKYYETAKIQPKILLNSDLDNAEEQLTICGIDYQQIKSEIVLCENHFRFAWNLPFRFTHRGIDNPKEAIQKDISIKSKLFKKVFERYWKNLPPTSFRRNALLVGIAEPSPNQTKLIERIKSFVTVYNLTAVDSNMKSNLEANELFDLWLEENML